MNPTFRIRNAAFGFPDEADAGEDEIHILVDVPQYVKTVPIMIEHLERWHPGMASPVSDSWHWLSAIFSSAETASSSKKDV
ncbi:hypothetical protein PF002_g10525 [Phytophthora fragariae]|nr:hypothetical protein PF009_g12631 [Phytophthora fragariae]KAE9144904.1 hypothetical protein PF006_g10213 [Phytophthora fragariae]KAE9238020.1 hypothetical protein PF004_g8424 [Phytophthora fragariae]KAE9238939.1 hypothetical protein PF002_g10525 [Phytophthora fragariae]KAE9342052.1 hypothetical protein PF008_g10336 [Phytophthora fragariae]